MMATFIACVCDVEAWRNVFLKADRDTLRREHETHILETGPCIIGWCKVRDDLGKYKCKSRFVMTRVSNLSAFSVKPAELLYTLHRLYTIYDTYQTSPSAFSLPMNLSSSTVDCRYRSARCACTPASACLVANTFRAWMMTSTSNSISAAPKS